MRVHCKRCDNKPFNSVSSLRRHQWKEHSEFYAKNGHSLVVRPTPETLPEMTARSLLAQLKSQATFMNDVVTLVEGLIK